MCIKNEYEKMSDRDLLRLFVSEKAADYLIKEYLTINEILFNTYPEELARVKGIGSKTSQRLRAVAEIASRVFTRSNERVTKIAQPRDVFQISRDMQNLSQEEVRAIYLDVQNQVIRVETISVGSATSATVSPREIFSRAVKLMASSIILVHNHPSGDTSTSPEDISCTEKVREAGEVLGIELLDHVIIGKGRYVSLKEKNKLSAV